MHAYTYDDERGRVKLDDIVFEIKDATLIDYPEGTFDVIYSR